MGVKRSHPRLTLAVLSLGGLAYAVLSSSVVPALSTIQHDLNASENGIAWVLTGYLLSASVGTGSTRLTSARIPLSAGSGSSNIHQYRSQTGTTGCC